MENMGIFYEKNINTRKELGINKQSEDSIWIEDARRIYRNFKWRINKDKWKELLKEDFCMNSNTKFKAMIMLLEFLYSNEHIPRNIWNVINDYFGFESNKDKISEKIPPMNLSYLFDKFEEDDELDYEMFVIGEYENIDKWIKEYEDILYELDNNNFVNAINLIENLKKYNIVHPNIKILEIKCFLGLGMINKARILSNELDSNTREKKTSLLVLADIENNDKKYEHAIEYYNKILSTNPDDIKVKDMKAECLLKLGTIRNNNTIK